MTYKEKVLSVIPLASNPKLLGGIPGCPGHYEFTSDGPACGGQGCIGAGAFNCEKCWNAEMPEQKKTEPKKAETPIDLIAKALESNDKSVHIRVEPDGITSVDIVPVGAFKETEEEPVSEPAESDGWLKIEYGTNAADRRIITKNEPERYAPVLVYCENRNMFVAYWSGIVGLWRISATGNPILKDSDNRVIPHTVTHWRPLPEPPKGG